MKIICKWALAAAVGALLGRAGLTPTVGEFWVWLALFATLILAHDWAIKEPA